MLTLCYAFSNISLALWQHVLARSRPHALPSQPSTPTPCALPLAGGASTPIWPARAHYLTPRKRTRKTLNAHGTGARPGSWHHSRRARDATGSRRSRQGLGSQLGRAGPQARRGVLAACGVHRLARCESATERAPLGGGRAADDIRDRRLGVLARHAAVLECRSWPVPALRNAYFVSTGPAPSESCRSSQADSGIAGG